MRGRKKLPIPNENILTAYDRQILSSPYPTLEKFKVYEKLLKACRNSLTALKRFLDTYYPIASKDRKTLRNYIKTYSLTKDAIEFVLQKHNSNPLVSKEELEDLVYCYIKTKLRRIVQTEGIEFSGFSETYTSREGDANEICS